MGRVAQKIRDFLWGEAVRNLHFAKKIKELDTFAQSELLRFEGQINL